MRGRALFVALLSCGVLLGRATPASAQTAADLFNPSAIQDISVLMNTRDLADMRANWQLNTKYPADLIWHNIRVRNVSVRSRGTGSRNPVKISLQISFDQYASSQRFLGLSSLVLKNEYQDPAMIRESVAIAFYNRMGVSAPRESFARVTVNGEYWGVYGVVEDLTADFLSRAFGEASALTAPRGEHGTDANGFLYEYHWQDSFWWRAEYLGDDINTYIPWFGPVTHDLDAGTTLYSPIRDLFREINGADDAVWRSRVESLVDLKQFMVFVAIEVYLSEWDGMTGNWGMNNFYLYKPPSALPYRFIPWDRDHSMLVTTGDSSIFLRTDDNVLFHRAMAYDDLRTLYLDTLEQCAQMAQQDDWFVNTVSANAALITDAAHADTKKFFANPDFDQAVLDLMNFAQVRPANVLQQVAVARGGSHQQ